MMTNFAAIVWITFVTNTIVPTNFANRGPLWYHTNIVSAVVVTPVPGVGNVTNTVPVKTNVIRFVLMQEAVK